MSDVRVIPGTPIVFWFHGRKSEAAERIAPSYEAEQRTENFPAADDPSLAPWVPHERFAPLGPACASLPTVRFQVLLPSVSVDAMALPHQPAILGRTVYLAPKAGLWSSPAFGFDQSTGLDDSETVPDDRLPPWLQPSNPPTEPKAKPSILSWLNRLVRARQAKPPALPDPAQPRRFGKRGLVPPDAARAEVSEADEAAAPPWRLTDPPSPTAVEPPAARRIEERRPSPVAPLPAEGAAPAGAPRLRHFGVRLPGRVPPPPPVSTPPIETPPLPAEGPTVAEAPTAVPAEPSPTIDDAPLPAERPAAVDTTRLRHFGVRLPKRAPSPLSASPAPAATLDIPPVPADSKVLADDPAVLPPLQSHRSRWFGLRRPTRTPLSPASGPRLINTGIVDIFRYKMLTDFDDSALDPSFADASLARRIEPHLPPLAPSPPEVPVVAEAQPIVPPPVTPEPSEDRDLSPPPADIVAAEIEEGETPEPSSADPAPPGSAIPAEPPAQPAAYWADPNWDKSAPTAPDQPESLAWTPPLPGQPAARPTTPALAGLWTASPAGSADGEPETHTGTGQRIIPRAAAIVVGLVVLGGAMAAIVLFLPKAFVSHVMPAATFNAPMMVLRATGPGRVASVAVQNGQTVEPDTLLLTIRTEPPPDPAATLLRSRLETAQAHLAELDQSIAQATATTEASHARVADSRLADLRRQRAAAMLDVSQLQDAVANIPPGRPAELPVKAGLHGVVRSLEARAGAPTAPGVPLIRMLDCDHAFLTVGPDSKLHAGEAVQVRLPNLPPVAATVRQSAGIAEPPDSLVIATAPGAFVGLLSGSCPIGAIATVTPSLTGRAGS